MSLIKKTLSSMAIAMLVSSVAIAEEKPSQKNSAMNDIWLDGKAETVLLLNKNLNSFTIDTKVNNGIVTLSGEVDSEIDKRLAGELVSGIKGVKNVKNELTVTNKKSISDTISSEYTDAKIATVVKTRLLLDQEIPGTKIDVSAQGGTITLKGSVKSSAQKDLAQAIAENTEDVKKVVNNLTVVK
ncbi:BON domain-containing protein [Microbulbifer variabilis]|uniref:BON domain-containing protein n=1 Tax=Microbulbifer variabilis TaxID=266805 RepID=UPI001CFEAC65|nr:BON domain-containing protein [Microbulbifer variabilis]